MQLIISSSLASHSPQVSVSAGNNFTRRQKELFSLLLTEGKILCCKCTCLINYPLLKFQREKIEQNKDGHISKQGTESGFDCCEIWIKLKGFACKTDARHVSSSRTCMVWRKPSKANQLLSHQPAQYTTGRRIGVVTSGEVIQSWEHLFGQWCQL